MSGNPYVNPQGWQQRPPQPRKFISCCYCGDDDFSLADVAFPSQDCTAHGLICLGCLAEYLERQIGVDGDPRSILSPNEIGFKAVEATLVQCPVMRCTQFIDIDTVRNYARPETFVRYERYLTNQIMKSAGGFKKCYLPDCHHGRIVLQTGHWWCQIAKARAAPKIREILQQRWQEAHTEVRRLNRRIAEMEDANAKKETKSEV
ncbi:hypothetical protein BPAE_0018g00160 [Botrytis paeoniae]|uniref:Uncharacterized protein n=1 Tax=Botrytis paeoniae TaxID=278948 RepID=A0A4Z1G0T9_9HELO|nr:hypothetical protein BPAE_0018g00160 [Botrytis paeoniae]